MVAPEKSGEKKKEGKDDEQNLADSDSSLAYRSSQAKSQLRRTSNIKRTQVFLFAI